MNIREINQKLLEVLGIEDKLITEVVITMQADKAPEVSITKYIGSETIETTEQIFELKLKELDDNNS